MLIDKNKLYIGAVALCVIIAGFLYMSGFSFNTQNNEGYLVATTPEITSPNFYLQPFTDSTLFYADTQDNEDVVEDHSYIRVFISGEVQTPDVYEIRSDARVIDLLNLAGGPTDYADTERINLAATLQDASHIIIPAVGEEIDETLLTQNLDDTQHPNQTQAAADGRVNINTATSTELQTLPGIGPVIAQNIVAHREANGNFRTIEEIQNVTRIGERTFANIMNSITVD